MICFGHGIMLQLILYNGFDLGECPCTFTHITEFHMDTIGDHFILLV